MKWAAKGYVTIRVMPQIIAFVMQVGLGATMGFYFSMVGFYTANFESKIFFLAMIFCMYLPATLIWLLQGRFDAWFDATYTAQVTYVFRVVGMLVLLIFLTLYWAIGPQTPYFVLATGFGIGVCSHTILSSSGQLMGSLDPSLTRYTAFGYLAGGTTPVVIVLLSGFSPTSHLWKFQMIVLTVPILCSICTSFLVYVLLTQDVFQETCERLTTQSLREIVSQDDLFYETLPSVRQKSDPGVVPFWVWLWCGYKSFSVCCTTTVMALTAFFGNPAMAQALGLSKLLMDILGAVAAMPLSRFESFSQAPWHNFILTCGAVRTCLFGALMVHLGGLELPEKVLFPIWLLFHGIHAVTNPHAAVTVAAFVDISDRKRVLRIFQGIKESGAVIALSMATAVLVPALNLGSDWPDSACTIAA